MAEPRRFLKRLVALFRSSRNESELAREITAHLQLLEDHFTAGGMSREDARYAARRAFGGVDQAKERQRDERSFRWLAGWPMDLRLGARMLVKSPGLTVIAVIALAVAIGAGAAYLEFLNDLLQPRFPGPDGDRVVSVRVWDVERSAAQTRAVHEFAAWRGRISTLDRFGAYRPVDRPLVTPDGHAEPVRAVEISADAFRLLPVSPIVGRPLLESDEQPGSAPVVVIGQDIWQSRFSSDPNVLGRTVQLGSTTYTIAGVMPAGFGFPMNHHVWVPLQLQGAGVARGEGPAIQIFGRLKEGTAIEVARAELSGIVPDPQGKLRIDVAPYLRSMMDADRGTVIRAALYSGNLLFVLLLAICGANVATLVFARTAMREAEITVRTALGASRGRICAQLFAEALVLSLVAAAAGLAFAAFVTRWVARIFIESIGQPLPFWWNEGLGLQTMVYAVALAAFAALIVGVIPALKATGPQLQGRLREAGASGSTMKFGGLWTGVIVAQVALTVLFISAVVSLGWTTLRAGADGDVTFDRDQFVTARLAVDEAAGRPAAVRYKALADKLRAQPGVVNVTYATELPGTTFGEFALEFATPGVADRAIPHERGLWCRTAQVGPQYFESLGAELVAGRTFTESEVLSSRPVAVVDETFVRLVLGGRNALGLMVRQPAKDGPAAGPWHEIVGVVRDVTVNARKKSYDGMIYRPVAIGPTAVHLLIRTEGTAPAIAQSLPGIAGSVGADVRFGAIRTLARAAYDEALLTRVAARVFIVVSAVALLLCTAGIYSLVSFTLARRTREIGIRIALGAAPRRIITTTFARAFVQVAGGVLLGAAPSAVLLMSGLEDSGGMSGRGLAVMFGVGVFVMAIALVACAGPLRRALRIDPMQALRTDA